MIRIVDREGLPGRRRLHRAIRAIAKDVNMYGILLQMPEMADGYVHNVGTDWRKAVTAILVNARLVTDGMSGLCWP